MHKTLFALGMIALTGLLAGCYMSNRALVHPTTGEKADCSSWGFGWLGAPAAAASTYSCVSKHEDLGYVDPKTIVATKVVNNETSPVSNTEVASLEDNDETSTRVNKDSETGILDSSAQTTDEEAVKFLNRLKSLRKEGILSDEEYDQKRKKFLEEL